MKRIILILIIVSFVAGLLLLKSITPINNNNDSLSSSLSQKTEENFVSLNQNETIEGFFNLIDNGNIGDALAYLHSRIIPDNETRNNWIKQFSLLKSITINSITKLNADEEIYRVQLTIGEIFPNATEAAIPNYGWNKGENVRWISLEKENDLWKISQIATGP